MPQSKEERKEYDRIRYLEKRESVIARVKQHKIDNKEKVKQYKIDNKEKLLEYRLGYRKRENELAKLSRIRNPGAYKKKDAKSRWKKYGIICDDFEEVYNHYINCHKCEYCDEEFKNGHDRCLDHDHSIVDRNNVRGVLCRNCNKLDVLDVDNLEFLTS